MAGRILRGAVVGATSLLGKELAGELHDSTVAAWDLTLLDTIEAEGQMTKAGDEALVIQPVSAESFGGIDVVFFAGKAATTLEFWEAAHTAGATIVDLTGALEGVPGVVVRSGWSDADAVVDLTTIAVVVMHPMGLVLGAMKARLKALGLKRLAATLMLPASEMGSAGVDELHQQTVGLLSFKPLEREVYDAQIGFNLLARLGGAAKVDLQLERAKIERQAGGEAGLLALQVLQAPVFHGFAASVYVEMSAVTTTEEIVAALQGGVLQIADEVSPSNDSAAGGGEMMMSVRMAETAEGMTFWIWMVGDNLRLRVRSAIGCAAELISLRPATRVN